MSIFKHNKISKLIVCGICAAIIAAVVAFLLPGSADASKNLTNTYALQITGGSSGGEYVQHFAVRYLSKDGQEHEEYILPHDGGLYDSLMLAKEHAPEDDRSDILEMLGIVDTGPVPERIRALQPGAMDTYLFKPQFTLDKLVGVDVVFQSDAPDLAEWTIQGLRLYKVDKIRSMKVDGYYGNQYTIRFDGKKLAHLREGEFGNTFRILGSVSYRLSADEDADMQLVFEEEPHEVIFPHVYHVQLTFADVYGAGYEQLTQAYDQKSGFLEAGFGEMLVMQIEYLDTAGDTRRVNVPVITATMGTMLELGASPEMMISGLAQQGDTIGFDCYLPQMDKILSMKLYSGSAAQYLTDLPIVGSESARIASAAIYRTDELMLDFDKTRADAPSYTLEADTVISFTSNDARGIELAADSVCTLSDDNVIAEDDDAADTYMLEFRADPKYITSIPTDLYIQLNYRSVLGEDMMTDELSVRELVKDYYGFWPASMEDFAYSGLICTDEGLRMFLDIADVDYFTGVVLTTEEAYDVFEIKDLAVSLVHAKNKRTAIWSEMVGSAAVSNRSFSRDVDASPIFRMEETFPIPRDEAYSVNFVSKSVLDISNVAWSAMSDSMTYAQSCADLGFMTEREHYSVEVRVHGGSTVNDLYGDCGSKNRFYFALEFENGRTGYVLANRQLGSDGFRVGHNETFSIYTNRDYGELLSVRIIADDISAESDPSDKLNIDEIRVCKDSSDAISKEWIVENVGWVGIGHHDISPEASGAGEQGRTEGELAQSYPVSGYANALNLEFYINTGVYPLGEKAPTFRGSIFASLEYFDNDGNRQIEEFDLVHALYRYADMPEQYAQNADLLTKARVISDPSKMFRENHTDRFILSLSDVSKLHKLSLRMVSGDECSLNINDVSVSLITSSGILLENDRDEFYRNHNAEYLCSDLSSSMPSYELVLPKGEEVLQEIYFAEHNEIKMDQVDHSWIAAISPEPESKYDEINVFVYPSDAVRGRFSLNAKVRYTDFLGRALANEAEGLERTVDTDGNEMFYVHGLSAAGITNLNMLQLTAISDENFRVPIDHAIVQQVRGGTVITSYYFDCDQKDAAEGFVVTPAADTSAKINEQHVMLMLGEKTKIANLLAGERDLAVALRYTIANDSDEREYFSEEIFLTEQGYSTVYAGDIIKLTFHENFIKEITGISLRTTGGLSAQVEMACVANYNISSNTGIKEQVGWYSFANGVFAGNTDIVMARTFNQEVQPLTVTFVTASAKESLESGTNDPIEMTLGYADSRGANKETVIKDINDYVISEGEPFVTGSTTTIELLLKDPEELRWLELMPYDNDSSYVTGWYLLELQIELGTSGRIQRVNRRVDHYLQEGNPDGYRVTLTNVTISLDVRALTENGGYGVFRQASSATNSSVSIVGYSGSKVLFENIKLTNTTQGFSYTVERVANDGSGAEVSGIMNAGGMSGSLNIPENYTGTQMVYRVTIYANEAPATKVTIQVMVDPVEKEPEPTQAAPEDDSIVPEDDYDLFDDDLYDQTDTPVDESLVPEEDDSAGNDEYPDNDNSGSDDGLLLPEDDFDLTNDRKGRSGNESTTP